MLKALLGVAILLAIGRQFWRDLSEHPDVLHQPLHSGWLLLSGVLYLLGIGFSALYWRRLLVHLGRQPSRWAAARAYYVSQLGKYDVGAGLATVTAFYEVLTTMAAGALLSAVLFALLTPETGAALSWDTLREIVRLETPPGGVVDRKTCVLLPAGLFVVCVTPLLPPLFNRLVHRLTRPFRGRDADAIAPFHLSYLVEGLLLTMLGWLFLGASLAAALEGTIGPGLEWTYGSLGRITALLGLAYVAGFVILIAPGGLGVREFFLKLLLTAEVATLRPSVQDETMAATVLVVVVLRIVWTLAEVVLAGILYLLPGSSHPTDEKLRIANCELRIAK